MILVQHDVTEAPRCLPRIDNKGVLRLPEPQQLEGRNSRLPNEPSGNARPVPDGSFRGGQNRLEPLASSVSFVDTRWALSRSLPQINHRIVHRDSFAGSPLDRMLKHAYRPLNGLSGLASARGRILAAMANRPALSPTLISIRLNPEPAHSAPGVPSNRSLPAEHDRTGTDRRRRWYEGRTRSDGGPSTGRIGVAASRARPGRGRGRIRGTRAALSRACLSRRLRRDWVRGRGGGRDAGRLRADLLRARSFRRDAPLRPWLLRIVANAARNRRSTASRRPTVELALVEERASDDPAESPEAAALATEQRHELLAAVHALRDEDRTVIACRYFLDLSEAETADALGCPRGTVKSRLSRALTRPRQQLAMQSLSTSVTPEGITDG